MLSRVNSVSSTGSGVTRRGFLQAGGAGVAGLSLSQWSETLAAEAHSDRAVILLMLVGGPSQLETWDPKPDAPDDVRGPFGTIATAVPGTRICEHLPKMARRLDRCTLIRSLSHDSAPIHETGQQLLQTGRICRFGDDHPHLGSVTARLLGAKTELPPFMVLPSPIASTGVSVPHGQSAGCLGSAFEPFVLAADPASSTFDVNAIAARARQFVRERPDLEARWPLATLRASTSAFDLAQERPGLRAAYGMNTFGQSCLLARRLVESGARVVTVNMFDTVFNRVTWDCHGSAPFSTLEDYARTLLPTLDRAFAALVDDLESRGLLETTLVVATGEFGRTPRINSLGGRDHWPGAWSALLAGGGVPGGQVIGATDAHGSSPIDRPVSPAELVATIYRAIRIDPARSLAIGEAETRLCDAAPIGELIG